MIASSPAILAGHLAFCPPKIPRSSGPGASFPLASNPLPLEQLSLLVPHGQFFLLLRRSPESATGADCKRSYGRASIGCEIGHWVQLSITAVVPFIPQLLYRPILFVLRRVFGAAWLVRCWVWRWSLKWLETRRKGLAGELTLGTRRSSYSNNLFMKDWCHKLVHASYSSI